MTLRHNSTADLALSTDGSRTAGSRDPGDFGLDLDRTVWDPEYRREVIERLATMASDPGIADKPG